MLASDGWPVGLDDAARWLRSGRVVAFPTETVYGLGADALDAEAVGLVFELKGRPRRNPLIVHVSDVSMARGLSVGWDDRAEALAARFWPGALTMVVGKADVVPGVVTGGGETVALRMPAHDVALGLIGRFGGGIVGPSANVSGGVSPTCAAHVREAFGDDERVMVLDGGECAMGIESTVVRLNEGGGARVLRRGVVGVEAIEVVLGERVTVEGGGDGDGKGGVLASPGMMRRHYSPGTAMVLVDRDGGVDSIARGARVVLLGRRDELDAVGARLAGVEVVRRVEMEADGGGYARGLYAGLREADSVGVDVLVVVRPTDVGAVWEAIRDRLTRAAARD